MGKDSINTRKPTDQSTVLIVDDDSDVRAVLRDLLGVHHRVVEASDPDCALRIVNESEPDVALLDLNLGQGPDHGFAFLAQLRKREPELPVVILSSYQDTDTIVRAMKAGASHYIGKTPRYDHLLETLRVVLADRRRSFELEAHRLPGGSEIAGSSTAMDEVRRLAAVAARSDILVLLLGETGTGKGLIASCIHRWGKRPGPYRDVNVAGLPTSVLDSELFGHEKGAYTGADTRRRGLFELTSGGTILLDEIGDLPRESQVKLLKVVETGTFARMGAENDLKTDTRVLAATHADLDSMVSAGTFRRDLYHRLAGLVIHVPPLRERLEDIPEIARAFLGAEARLSSLALHALMDHSWPGNVRELHQTLRRAALFSGGGTIELEHLGQLISEGNAISTKNPGPGAVERASMLVKGQPGPDGGLHDTGVLDLPYAAASAAVMDRFRMQYLERLLRRCEGNVAQAARVSGVARPHLHALIKQYGLSRAQNSKDE